MLKNPIWIFLIALVILIMFLPSFSRMMALKYQDAQYKREIDLLEQKKAELIAEKEKLLNDPEYLEKVARERMGIAREGEVLYRLEPMNEAY